MAYQPGQYIACSFMIMNGTSNTLLSVLMPTMMLKSIHRNKCWVPFQHILCCISAPEVEDISARQHRLSLRDYDRIVRIYEQSQKNDRLQ